METCAACGRSSSSGNRPIAPRTGERQSPINTSRHAADLSLAAGSSRDEAGPAEPMPGKRLVHHRGRGPKRMPAPWRGLSLLQKMNRLVLYGSGPTVLAVLALFLSAPGNDPDGACPGEGTPAAQAFPTILADSGNVVRLDLTEPSVVNLTIYAADENRGGQMDLRRQMGRLMRGLHQVAQCFPAVKIIHADLLAPADVRRDEHGDLFAGFEMPIVSLAIEADDLRAFRQDFEWEDYPIYAANRYARWISVSLNDVWHRELENEELNGNFVDSL